MEVNKISCTELWFQVFKDPTDSISFYIHAGQKKPKPKNHFFLIFCYNWGNRLWIMEKQANSCLPFSFLVLVLIFFCVEVDCNFVNYDTGGGVVDGKLNVHLVAHSHDDVGWLKTIDQYYVGSNNSIQVGCYF